MFFFLWSKKALHPLYAVTSPLGTHGIPHWFVPTPFCPLCVWLICPHSVIPSLVSSASITAPRLPFAPGDPVETLGGPVCSRALQLRDARAKWMSTTGKVYSSPSASMCVLGRAS